MAHATIATHNGSQVAREHNRRNPKVVSKESHIQENGIYEIWKDETERHAYKRIFQESVDKYNLLQKNDKRKILDYYKQIQEDKKKHTAYEMIVGVYSDAVSDETKKEILKEFYENWKERNPNLELIGAYWHNDEEGDMHLHLDYIPIAHGYTKGMETQTSISKALEQQGFVKEGKNTAQILWEKRENKYLEQLCNKRDIDVIRPGTKKEHLETQLFKLTKKIESLEKLINDYSFQNDKMGKEYEEIQIKLINAASELKDVNAELATNTEKNNLVKNDLSTNSNMLEEMAKVFEKKKKEYTEELQTLGTKDWLMKKIDFYLDKREYEQILLNALREIEEIENGER